MEKNTKSPAFQLYVQDFLSGVKFFSAEETGAYILLLCEQWDSGFIEDNDKILKKITGISPKKLQKVLEKFEKKDKKLINFRLDQERIKREDFLSKASKAGGESARKRAEEKARLVEIELQLKSKSSLSSSLSSSNSTNSNSEFNFDFIEENWKMPFRVWVKYRADINKPFTIQTAFEMAYKELKEKANNSPLEAFKIIQYSISNQYQSLCKPSGGKFKTEDQQPVKASTPKPFEHR